MNTAVINDWQVDTQTSSRFFALLELFFYIAIVLLMFYQLMYTPVIKFIAPAQPPAATMAINLAALERVIPVTPPPIATPPEPEIKKQIEPKPSKPELPPEPSKVKTKEESRAPSDASKQTNDTSQDSRQRAQKTGLLALNNQVSGLLATDAANLKADKAVQAAPTAAEQPAVISAKPRDVALNTDVSLPKAKPTELAAAENAEDIKAKTSKAALDAGSAGKNTGSRSNADIARVFSQNKNNLDVLYERARRELPGLQGKLVLDITIDADGKVTNIAIVSSELANSELENKIVARVKMFKFSASNAGSTLRYPIEFLPA